MKLTKRLEPELIGLDLFDHIIARFPLWNLFSRAKQFGRATLGGVDATETLHLGLGSFSRKISA